jgi:hypothetical protein
MVTPRAAEPIPGLAAVTLNGLEAIAKDFHGSQSPIYGRSPTGQNKPKMGCLSFLGG